MSIYPRIRGRLVRPTQGMMRAASGLFALRGKAMAPGGGYVLAPGCEYPPNADLMGAVAMVKAAEKYGRYPIR